MNRAQGATPLPEKQRMQPYVEPPVVVRAGLNQWRGNQDSPVHTPTGETRNGSPRRLTHSLLNTGGRQHTLLRASSPGGRTSLELILPTMSPRNPSRMGDYCCVLTQLHGQPKSGSCFLNYATRSTAPWAPGWWQTFPS